MKVPGPKTPLIQSGTPGSVQSADGASPEGAAKKADPTQLAPKIEKGLIDVPGTPPGPVAQAVAARQVAAPFDSFMKVRTFEVDLQRPGTDKIQTVKVDIVSGPGHNCSIAAPIVLDDKGRPALVLKAGDTRAARALRGEDYVKIGMIGGRWDKVGADPKKIGLEEIAEEIGAQLIPGGYIPLGDKLVPTMPQESTESDRYFAAVVRMDEGALGSGDGSGMEAVGLMKPVTMSIADAVKAMDGGKVGEGARMRLAYQRALDAIGFIPELDAYVHDLPGPLKKRFDTLGLGAPTDPRQLASAPSADEASEPKEAPVVDAKAAQINDVAFVSQKEVVVSDHAVMLDAKTTHVAKQGDTAETVGDAFPNQIYHLDYDRAKIAPYYQDPLQGPMVQMVMTERPALAAKALALDGERTYKDENTDLVALDLPEVRVDLDGAKGKAIGPLADAAVADAVQGSKARRLGAPVDASPGQSDLRYHFYATQVKPPDEAAGFVPLSDAIAACRAGQGDAATEALLLRLASDVGWIPSLRMPVARAQKLAGV